MLSTLFIVSACSPLTVVNELSPSRHFVATAGVAYGDQPYQTLDVYQPIDAQEASPVVVFFYGGAWRKGNKENFEFVASSLTSGGYAVIIADYRRFPDVTFPTFVEDGAQAVAWAVQNAGIFNLDPGRVFLMGHSAGAHLAAMLSMDGRYLAHHDIANSDLKGFIGLSGPYDFADYLHGYLLEVFPEDTRARSQPVDFVSADAPPTLLIHGTGDDLVYDANSESLARHLEAEGVEVTLKLYEGTGHAATVVSLAPPLEFVAEALDDTRLFLDAHSGDTH